MIAVGTKRLFRYPNTFGSWIKMDPPARSLDACFDPTTELRALSSARSYSVLVTA
jgi:hypothetical protein